MTPPPADVTPKLHRYRTVFVSQLVLTAVAVLLSSLRLGTHLSMVLVLLVAGLNATLVVLAMGVRRDGRFISTLALGTLVLILGLLIWPAWDVYSRVRPF